MTTPAISSAADFKARTPSGIPHKLPSGLTCEVKRPGITELIAEGLFPDSLMGLVSAFVNKAEGKKPQDRKPTKAQQKKNDEEMQNKAMAQITSDPEKLRDMLLTVDRATVYCVVNPPVHMNRFPEGHDREGQIIPPAERNEDFLYVDNIDEEDRMDIFNFAVGGDSDERSENEAAVKFPESDSDVGVVQGSKDVERSSE